MYGSDDLRSRIAGEQESDAYANLAMFPPRPRVASM